MEVEKKDDSATVPLSRTDSLISTRSKESIGGRKAGIIAELVTRAAEGKIARIPTFQADGGDDDDGDVEEEEKSVAAPAEVVSKDSIVKTASVAEEVEKEESEPATPTADIDENTKSEVETPSGTKEEAEAAAEVLLAKSKEEIVEDTTEATYENEVITEEKNNVVLQSSASEVEVTAGSGFERFCCGFTLRI